MAATKKQCFFCIELSLHLPSFKVQGLQITMIFRCGLKMWIEGQKYTFFKWAPFWYFISKKENNCISQKKIL